MPNGNNDEFNGGISSIELLVVFLIAGLLAWFRTKTKRERVG